jgi:SAM-dependent methyltransferase
VSRPLPEHVRETRVAYDTVAASYAGLLHAELAAKPLDRPARVFAELVRGGGPVAGLGCGRGRVTAYLHDLGVSAFGIDLSPGMIAQVRLAYPHLRFRTGSMAELDLTGGGFRGDDPGDPRAGGLREDAAGVPDGDPRWA